jgi:hypothetical protein
LKILLFPLDSGDFDDATELPEKLETLAKDV